MIEKKKYLMLSGVLSRVDTNEELAKISNIVLGPEKRIRLAKTKTEYRTETIRDKKTFDATTLKGLEYRLLDCSGNPVIRAFPHYAPEDDPSIKGWPLNRLPRINTLQFEMNGHYVLTMLNSSNYSLCREDGSEVMRIIHRGLIGGWNIEEWSDFSPEIICGLFVFCRYLEHENEFETV